MEASSVSGKKGSKLSHNQHHQLLETILTSAGTPSSQHFCGASASYGSRQHSLLHSLRVYERRDEPRSCHLGSARLITQWRRASMRYSRKSVRMHSFLPCFPLLLSPSLFLSPSLPPLLLPISLADLLGIPRLSYFMRHLLLAGTPANQPFSLAQAMAPSVSSERSSGRRMA